MMAIPESALRTIIAAASLGLLIFTALKKDLGVVSPPAPSPLRWWLGVPAAMLLGAYGSLYGAGLGTFLTYLLVILFGQTFLESAGTRKVSIGLQALLSSILYIRAGIIDPWAALNLFIAMGLGSYFGARYGSRLGNAFVRRAFITLAGVLCIKILL